MAKQVTRKKDRSATTAAILCDLSIALGIALTVYGWHTSTYWHFIYGALFIGGGVGYLQGALKRVPTE
tara:strand:- start:303 stop:506 length:204 start_codon:yes stop_codon:yes gene_type:complete